MDTRKEIAKEVRLNSAVLVLLSAAALIAVADLFGWWLHLPWLTGVFPEAATMKPNTAVCVLLLALAVVLNRTDSRFRRASGLAAGCAVALTALTLLEYWTGHAFGIDQILAAVPPERAGDPMGRMSQGTAISGLFTGLALLGIDIVPVLARVFCGLAGLITLSALVGSLFDAGPLLGVPLLRSMAIRTALAFGFMQVSYFLLRPEEEPLHSFLRSASYHRMGGWFVFFTCSLPLILGWPIAVLYRHGRFETTFAFAILVVLLMAAQALLTAQNSRSVARVEARRERVELERRALAKENAEQYRSLVASEHEAATKEAQYRLITDALPALIAYLDRDLRYVRANKTYEEWFGCPRDGMEVKRLDEVLGTSAENVRSHLYDALEGTPQHFEAQFQTLQGDRIVSLTHIPDIDESGTVRGVVVQGNDITVRKQSEAALRQAEKLAAVGKLASSIAHEINNPLEAVTNLLYIASTEDNIKEVREYLNTAEEQLRRVAAIANQTLRFHKQSKNPSAVTASALFSSVLSIYGPRLTGRILLEERHRPSTPVVCMDGEIRQVLNNLVGNAVDAMQGSGRLLIRSREGRSSKIGKPGLILTVADTGTGMSAKTLSTIFEAFFTTKGMSGTGLGLWVSKEIIDRHEGVLLVKSSQSLEYHGTVFRLFLPYRNAFDFIRPSRG